MNGVVRIRYCILGFESNNYNAVGSTSPVTSEQRDHGYILGEIGGLMTPPDCAKKQSIKEYELGKAGWIFAVSV